MLAGESRLHVLDHVGLLQISQLFPNVFRVSIPRDFERRRSIVVRRILAASDNQFLRLLAHASVDQVAWSL